MKSRQSWMGCSIIMAAGVTAALLLAPNARANGFRNPPAGAAALGMDGALTVWIDDASAVSHNPANLAGLESSSVLVGLDTLHTKANFRSSAFATSTEDPWKVLPHVFAAWPINDEGLVAGLGVSSPYGQSTEWNQAVPFPYFSEMLLVDVSPGIGAKVSDTLSLGVAVNLYASELDLRQLIPWAPLTGGAVMAPPGSAELEGDGYAVGASLGLTWDVAPGHRLAAHYRSQFDMDYDGDTKVSGIPVQFAGLLAPTSDFDSEIKFPNVVSFGYGWQVNDDVRVGVDLEWTEHSRNRAIPIGLGVNSAAGLFPAAVPQDWDDTWNLGAAGSWQMHEEIVLRGSYKYLETPIPDETFSPSLMDADKHMLTVAFGWTRGPHSVDASATYGILDDREITESPTPQYNGTYELDSVILGLTYGRQF